MAAFAGMPKRVEERMVGSVADPNLTRKNVTSGLEVLRLLARHGDVTECCILHTPRGTIGRLPRWRLEHIEGRASERGAA